MRLDSAAVPATVIRASYDTTGKSWEGITEDAESQETYLVQLIN